MRLSTGMPLPLKAVMQAMLDEWLGSHFKVTGQRCDHAGKCESTIKADLQLQRVAKSLVSGKYRADFNGQHFEGQFAVKYRKRSPLCLCE